MQPCIHEDRLVKLEANIRALELSDAEKNVQIKNLVKSIDSLIGWIKLFIGTTLAATIGMVVAYLRG